MPANDANESSSASTQGATEADAPNFTLQFIVETGEAYPGGLYQWSSVLNVSGGKSPRCSMLLNRHNGDLIGRPVGVFSDVLPRMKARQMAARLDAAAATDLPKSTKGDISSSTLRLKYIHESTTLTTDFNAQNHALLNAISPVMDDLRALMSQLLNKPESAVIVSVDKKEGPDGIRFQFTLTNLGTRELTVADPRIIPRYPLKKRAVVQVAQAPVRVPGQMEIPPRWQPLAMEPAPPGVADVGVVIAPNGTLAVSSGLWVPSGAGEFLAQGVWQDYNGPIKIDPLKFQSVIPQSSGPDPKPYILRGAAFSKYTRFTVARK